MHDKGFVGQFTDNAASIFEAAELALQTGQQLSNMTIVIEREGGIRMIAESDWPLESLQAHHGAQMVYRVHRHDQSVRLEGRSGSRTCRFESEKLNEAACRLLRVNPSYELASEGRQLLTAARWQDLPGACD